MRCYILLTNILVLSLIALIFGGNVRDRICNRLLPKNRVGRQDYLDHVKTFISFVKSFLFFNLFQNLSIAENGTIV